MAKPLTGETIRVVFEEESEKQGGKESYMRKNKHRRVGKYSKFLYTSKRKYSKFQDISVIEQVGNTERHARVLKTPGSVQTLYCWDGMRVNVQLYVVESSNVLSTPIVVFKSTSQVLPIPDSQNKEQVCDVQRRQCSHTDSQNGLPKPASEFSIKGGEKVNILYGGLSPLEMLLCSHLFFFFNNFYVLMFFMG
ncbi:hypothetical protein ISN44_As02g009530, partial [Arabidopsis suecica]